jgi:hypothetical protein
MNDQKPKKQNGFDEKKVEDCGIAKHNSYDIR